MKKEIIEDWGPIKEGARKFKEKNLTGKILKNLTQDDLKKIFTRTKTWVNVNPKILVENGTPAFVVYWQRAIRKLTYRFPAFTENDSRTVILHKCNKYLEQMLDFKELVCSVSTEEDIKKFYEDIKAMPAKDFKSRFGAIAYKGTILESAYNLSEWKLKCKESDFPNRLRKASTERKKVFTLPKLETIERDGPDYLDGQVVTKEMWEDIVKLLAMQFGVYVNQKERRKFLKDCLYAFLDLASAVDIISTDLSFGHRLSLAFGARGSSRAAAHYEPDLEIINLTKTRGAGCVAHEWMHAMDDMLAKHCGIDSGKLASESVDTCRHMLPASFVKLVNALQADEEGNPTDFFRGSSKMDRVYAKDSHGYWSSKAEMLARAFACYVKDTLGFKSDFLIAYADVYEFEYDDERICAIPQGDERELLNGLFDQMFFELKEMGFLTQQKISLFDESAVFEPMVSKKSNKKDTKSVSKKQYASVV